MSFTKWPKTKMDYIDLIIEIAFWGFLLWIWFFGIKVLCDPNVICAPCLDIITQTGMDTSNFAFNITDFIG